MTPEASPPMRRFMLGLLREGRLDLPLPGSGGTAQRFDALCQLAREDLSAARLAEAHTDAMAILAEADHAVPDGLLGVWASEGPSSRVRASAPSFRRLALPPARRRACRR